MVCFPAAPSRGMAPSAEDETPLAATGGLGDAPALVPPRGASGDMGVAEAPPHEAVDVEGKAASEPPPEIVCRPSELAQRKFRDEVRLAIQSRDNTYLEELLGKKDTVATLKHWPPLDPSGYCNIASRRVNIKALAKPPHEAIAWRSAFKAAGDGTADPNMLAIRALRALIWLQTEKAIDTSLKGHPAPHLPPLDLAKRPMTTKVAAGAAVAASGGRRRRCQVRVIKRDFLDEASDLAASGSTVAVLNMANAYSPGGGYIGGAGAQEENLHRRSDCYRFTVRFKSKYYPIPNEACLVSPDVTVLRGSEESGYPFLDRPFKVTVISCAAVSRPSLNSNRDYSCGFTKELMKAKVAAIVFAAEQTDCDAVVLSAFGCGAFGNPPEVVACMFREALEASNLARATFCIFDDHNAGSYHNPCGNFRPFREVFEDLAG